VPPVAIDAPPYCTDRSYSFALRNPMGGFDHLPLVRWRLCTSLLDRLSVRFWPDSGLVDAGCRVADWRKVLQIARGVDCYHIYRSWSKEFDGAVFGGVAKHQRFTSEVLVQCQIRCQIWASEGSGRDANSKAVSKLLIPWVPFAGSSPSLSTKIKGSRDSILRSSNNGISGDSSISLPYFLLAHRLITALVRR
jgi:hypothetical protein